jgi:hypothetical protein
VKRLRVRTRTGAMVLAASLIAGCSGTGGSYGPGLGGRRGHVPGGPSVDEIVAKLELSEERGAEVRGVLEASEDERAEIMSKHAGARGRAAFEEAREELDSLRARTEVMLEPLLTDEQMARYREIIDQAEAERERAREETRSGRPRGPGGGLGRPPGF